MPDSTNNVWIDSSFYEHASGNDDTVVRYTTAVSDNIGRFSMPVIYSPISVGYVNLDLVNAFIIRAATHNNAVNIASSTTTPSGNQYGVAGVYNDIVYSSSSSYSSITKDTMLYYSSGYTATSGCIDSKVDYISGNNYSKNIDAASYFWMPVSLSGIRNFISNYTNYTGSTEIDGTPVPSYSGINKVDTVYSNIFDTFYSSSVNSVVDVSFAGWVDFPFSTSLYSALEASSNEIITIIEVVDGKVTPVDIDTFSCLPEHKSVMSSLYSTIQYGVNIDYCTNTISGAVLPFNTSAFSSTEYNKGLGLDINLLSLKISDLSISVGQFVTSSGVIYIDVTDDEYDVSLDNTYLMVDANIVPTISTPITNGFRLSYAPADSFSLISGPVIITIHAENSNGIFREEDFYVTFGYIVEYNNNQGFSEAIDYGFDNKVAVRITVEDYANCPTLSSVAWEFESKSKFNSDIGASINGRLYGLDNIDMSASIFPLSTAYFYGKEVRVLLNAKDFAGNQMDPLILIYKIEDKP